METVDGIIVRNINGTCYAAVKNYERDIIIDQRFYPTRSGLDLLGKWVRIQAQGGRATERLQIISDIFPSRVCRGVVEIKVDINHVGVSDNGIQMYHNNYWGSVCDPRNVLGTSRPNAQYSAWIVKHIEAGLDSKWRVSIEQDSNMEIAAETYSAIVHSYSNQRDLYYAWSSRKPSTTLCIAPQFSPNGINLIGKWIEVGVNASNRAVAPVKILKELYETRNRNGIVEVNVYFLHDSRVRNDFELFHHNWFGKIADVANILDDCEKGGKYRGWIVYMKDNDIDARWRLAAQQNIEGPLRDFDMPSRSRAHSPARSDASSGRNRPRSPPSQGYRGGTNMNRGRSRSPTNSWNDRRSPDNYGRQNDNNYPSNSRHGSPNYRRGGRDYSTSPERNVNRGGNNYSPRRRASPRRRSRSVGSNSSFASERRSRAMPNNRPDSRNGSEASFRNPPSSSNSNNQNNPGSFSSYNPERKLRDAFQSNGQAKPIDPSRSSSAATASGYSDKDKKRLRMVKAESKNVVEILDHFLADENVQRAIMENDVEKFHQLEESLNYLKNMNID